MTTQAPDKDKKELAKPRKTLVELLNDDEHKARLASILGADARSFAQNILTVYNSSEQLQKCDPESIIAACEISASINLSILPSLGHSCVVPYDGVAQWQIMWKGLIQLAHRSGQYRKTNLAHVYEGELVSYNRFSNTIVLDESKRKSGRVQGYYFFFELLNGGFHEFYWSAKECVEHGLRYSKSFQKELGKWTEDPAFKEAGGVAKWLAGKEPFLTEGSGADAMSAKTIVKNELQTWGPLETRIKELVANDQAVIGSDGRPQYIDVTAEPATAAAKPTPPPTAAKGEKPKPEVIIAWARDASGKQGVPAAQFDAWLALQPGDEAAKAAAAEKAWKSVSKKDATAAQAFAIDAETPKDSGAEEKEATFLVYSVTESDINGEPATCVRDTTEPNAVKYFCPLNGDVAKAAKGVKGTKNPLAVKFVDKPVDKTTARWITKLA